MSAATALRAGFARVAERPSAYLAEVTWRWAAQVAIMVLALTGVAEFLNSVEVTGPYAFAGAGTHFLQLIAILLGGAILLWCTAAAAGRNAVLLPLCGDQAPGNYRALFWLNFLRAVLLLAAVPAFGGAWLAATIVSAKHLHPLPWPDAAGFWLIFCPLAVLIAGAWALLYWLLTLAPIPAAGSGMRAPDALACALAMIHERPLQLAAVGLVFGVLRLVSLWITVQVAWVVFSVGAFSRPAEAGLFAVIVAMYCVFSEYLYVARLGAYAAVVQASRCEVPA